MADFLLEIGLEEVPARMLDGASADLARRVSDLLVRERLATAAKVESYATPRRLAVLAREIQTSQPDVEDKVFGPSLKVSFKNGEPTQAAHAFAKKVGMPVEKLEKATTPKGEYLAAKVVNRGRPAGEVLAEELPKEIARLYWPKSMYWRSKSERFVRPVRWLVAMLDGEVIPLEFAGVRAEDESRGHRVLGEAVKIPRAGDYAQALADVRVVAAREAREDSIRKALDAAARGIPGARWREDAELLNTVVNLTESPAVILGNFDREFLALPEEVLVTVMRDHQKYFALEDASGKLAPHFLAVLNTDGDPAGIIRHGNERVLRARFNDARFFWQTDQKISLKDRVERLRNVTFQKELGSYYDKTLRVQKLASVLSQTVKDAGLPIRPGIVHKAAWLAKGDLTTELVKEFTELQGVVGGLYAKAQGLDPAIGDAIYDHYKPESMEDPAPRTVEGAALSIADKADSIAGMFALGLQPTGSKDPFALRRQANGIVKTIAEHKLAVSVRRLFADALEGYKGSEAEKSFSAGVDFSAAVASFFRERLEFYLREVLGLEYDTVNAVLAAGADDVVDVAARAQAVSQVRASEDFKNISIAFKRMKNILRQAAEANLAVATALERERLKEPVELRLYEQMFEVASQVQQLRVQHDYVNALLAMAPLRPTIDEFFDKIMVMVEEENIRANRLRLLQALVDEFSTIADFSEIVTEGK